MGSAAAGFKGNRRKYQSNEYIKDINLNWMDFHARQYDPQLGRFLGVDPLADGGGQEIYSPYAAMGNMPESCIDPDGMQYQMMNKNLFNVVQASGGRNEYGTFIDGGAPAQIANGTWGVWGMGASFAVYQSCFVAREEETVATTTGSTSNIDLGVPACNHTTTATGRGRIGNGDGVLPSDAKIVDATPTTITYSSESMGYITVENDKNIQRLTGPDHVNNFDGFWGKVDWTLNGGTVGNSSYDWNGNLQGLAPMSGTPPVPSFKGVKIVSSFKKTSTALRSALAGRIGKRGFTEIGYQFQKHASRGGIWSNAIEEGATLNPATYNQAGYNTFKEIWRGQGSFEKVGGFIEKRLSDGRGIRFQDNWIFKGFID